MKTGILMYRLGAGEAMLKTVQIVVVEDGNADEMLEKNQ